MQSQLNDIPSQDLGVYIIWIPMLGSSTRDELDENSMADPLVLHFWDGDDLAMQWFAGQVDGYNGIAWDVYYLYGPDADWEDDLNGRMKPVRKARE